MDKCPKCGYKSKPDLETYEQFVKSAADNDVDVTLPNSDNAHAKIVYKYMLQKARDKIYLYTDSFENSFFKSLISQFNKIDDNVKIFIISEKRVSKKFKDKFKKDITVIQKKTSFKSHFMIVDKKIYRYEKHPYCKGFTDIENSMVNFNDKRIVSKLTSVFNTIKKCD